MRNLINDSFKKKFFALIAIILMMTSAMPSISHIYDANR